MTWVERALATPCPEGHRVGGGCSRTSVSNVSGVRELLFFCASRIAAAEGAEKPARSQRHSWSYLITGAMCSLCGTRRKSIGPSMFRYSHDNGVTWTPGPDACPGRRP